MISLTYSIWLVYKIRIIRTFVFSIPRPSYVCTTNTKYIKCAYICSFNPFIHVIACPPTCSKKFCLHQKNRKAKCSVWVIKFELCTLETILTHSLTYLPACLLTLLADIKMIFPHRPFREIPGCTGQCQVTFCTACYFSEETRPLPTGCSDCGSPISSEGCLESWAKCIHWADRLEHGRVSNVPLFLPRLVNQSPARTPFPLTKVD